MEEEKKITKNGWKTVSVTNLTSVTFLTPLVSCEADSAGRPTFPPALGLTSARRNLSSSFILFSAFILFFWSVPPNLCLFTVLFLLSLKTTAMAGADWRALLSLRRRRRCLEHRKSHTYGPLLLNAVIPSAFRFFPFIISFEFAASSDLQLQKPRRHVRD